MLRLQRYEHLMKAVLARSDGWFSHQSGDPAEHAEEGVRHEDAR
jgi:hypothetical protein